MQFVRMGTRLPVSCGHCSCRYTANNSHSCAWTMWRMCELDNLLVAGVTHRESESQVSVLIHRRLKERCQRDHFLSVLITVCLTRIEVAHRTLLLTFGAWVQHTSSAVSYRCFYSYERSSWTWGRTRRPCRQAWSRPAASGQTIRHHRSKVRSGDMLDTEPQAAQFTW